MTVARVELIDASVLLQIVGVPHESADQERIIEEFDERSEAGVRLQLSASAIVETGNHVSQIVNGHHRRNCAERLGALVLATTNNEAPWHFRPIEWDHELLRQLIEPSHEAVPHMVESLTAQFLAMGDLLIVSEFQRLRANLDLTFIDVDVWTEDNGLRGIVDSIREPPRRRRQ